MISLQKLTKYAEKQGFRSEIFTNYFDFMDQEISLKSTFVGICTGNIWHWYEGVVSKYDSLEENTEALFYTHSYSVNTGKTTRTKAGRNIKYKALGI
jgi:hypothetical protein